MLEIRNLRKNYKKKTVLDGVSLTVGDGVVCGLIGMNGAGKSTLMKIVCGLTRADGGVILTDGKLKESNAGIGYMIESPAFYADLTGRDNLRAFAKLYEGVGDERVDEALSLVGMTKSGDVVFRNYSVGMKQRLYFAYAILARPRLLVLDEPFVGMDAVTVTLLRQLIADFAAAGNSVLVSDHVLPQLQRICGEAYILNEGKIVWHGRDMTQNLEQIFMSVVAESGAEAQ